MAIRLKRITPHEAREAMVGFFWRMRAWPFGTEEEYFQYWDWRYTHTSDGPAAVWIAMDDDRIVGHLAVNFRNFQVSGQPIRVGVPVNFLVDDEYRDSMIGPLLARAPQKMVRRRELDLFLCEMCSAAAHQMFVGLGLKDLGTMLSLVEVRRWAPVLRRRITGGTMLAPLASAVARFRKLIKNGTGREHPEGFVVRDMTAEEVAMIDRSHWPRPQGLAWDGTGAYLSNRFLRCPNRSYQVVGIFDELTQRIEGILVTEGSARLNVILCATNQSLLSEVQAVDLAVDLRPEVEVVVVPLLPQTSLATEFSRAAFFPRFGVDADSVVQNSYWSAYWLPDHPLASPFAQTEGWKLWFGWNQH